MKQMILMAAALGILGISGPAAAASEWRYTVSATSSAAANRLVAAEPPSTEQMQTAASPSTDLEPYTGSVPTNYMSMTTVTAQFGDPDRQAPAVGQPPITRWYYPRYTVYFEHDRVIISVID